ncbi:PREDICTED: serine/arginine-rich splicing factor 6-like [Priapulus caudatus]|uniref:Serine/arginine-rich splicing factor 6-like n=1 Tax=Priapulus caudatus TaxID=37621 RepID=A0ABM1DPA5_PRICU|nr:PREDICTED: serine/arginine-rich splicing factor 6-like [Priapulus caudatus]
MALIIILPDDRGFERYYERDIYNRHLVGYHESDDMQSQGRRHRYNRASFQAKDRPGRRLHRQYGEQRYSDHYGDDRPRTQRSPGKLKVHRRRRSDSRSRSDSMSSSSSGSASTTSDSDSDSHSSSRSPSSSKSRTSGNLASAVTAVTNQQPLSMVMINSNSQDCDSELLKNQLAICVKNLPIRSSDTSLKMALFHE